MVSTENGGLMSPPLSESPPSGVSKSSDERLLDLTNRTRYNLVQRNGQRIYGGPPPDWVKTVPAPEKGCEIFVGKVPRDCYEDELVPIFEQVGKIYELRLMMDFSGSNRGYFFVRYTNREDAKRACRQLNNYEIRPGKYLGVIQSVDNRKLWISGIPKNRSAAEIKEAMEGMTDGVRNVILYQSQQDKSKTRGYAFVEYESHRAAALARRKLVPGRIYLLGHEIEKVDWAEPENEVDEEIMNKVRILFVRNLMPSTSENQIRRVFEELGEEPLERVKKTKDYAFVHFSTREGAEKAMSNCVGLLIDGSCIDVSWSKPVDKQIYNTRKHLTKILSGGSVSGSSNGMLTYDSPLAQLNPLTPVPTFGYNGIGGGGMGVGGGAGRGIAPRKRGAAGIRGLGAPGTLPPRRLVKMSGLNSCGAANNSSCGDMNNGGFCSASNCYLPPINVNNSGGGNYTALSQPINSTSDLLYNPYVAANYFAAAAYEHQQPPHRMLAGPPPPPSHFMPPMLNNHQGHNGSGMAAAAAFEQQLASAMHQMSL